MSCGRRHVLFVIALASLSAARVALAAERDLGVLRVEFLYAIETAGGRGERLKDPLDVTVDRKTGEIYVVDGGTGRIQVYDRNGAFLQTIDLSGLGAGTPGTVAVDGAGRIYVGHLSSGAVSLLDYRGEFLETLTPPGVIDVPGSPVRTMALATGANGEVYALKTAGGVVKLDPAGESHEEVPIVGGETPALIFGMAVDRAGKFLFTDMRPYSVVVFDPKARESRRFGSAGVLYGQLDRPVGIAADAAGHMFVVSTVTNKVSCFGPDGEFLEEFGRLGRAYGQFYMPTRVASDGADRLYVLENGLKRVQVFRVEFLKERGEARSSSGAGTPGAS